MASFLTGATVRVLAGSAEHAPPASVRYRSSRSPRNAPDSHRPQQWRAEDLMQVGYMGLMKAINGFDPAMGDSLGAYAQPCVSGEIKRYFRDKRWQMRVQRPAQELRLRIRAATEELTQQLVRRPADAELAVWLGVGTAELEAAQLASQVFQLASLDAPLAGEQDVTVGDLVGAGDPQIEHAVDIEAVWQHWPQLPARQQRLLMMRFYGNMTQAQIGEALGISQMHVSGCSPGRWPICGSSSSARAALVAAAMAGADGPLFALGVSDPREWGAAGWASDVQVGPGKLAT